MHIITFSYRWQDMYLKFSGVSYSNFKASQNYTLAKLVQGLKEGGCDRNIGFSQKLNPWIGRKFSRPVPLTTQAYWKCVPVILSDRY